MSTSDRAREEFDDQISERSPADAVECLRLAAGVLRSRLEQQPPQQSQRQREQRVAIAAAVDGAEARGGEGGERIDGGAAAASPVAKESEEGGGLVVGSLSEGLARGERRRDELAAPLLEKSRRVRRRLRL